VQNGVNNGVNIIHISLLFSALEKTMNTLKRLTTGLFGE